MTTEPSTRRSEQSKESSAGTVTRVIQVLRHVAEADGETTVMAVADGVGLPASTAHRMLNILCAENLISRNERGSYGVGFEFQRLAELVLDQNRIAVIAGPVVARISEMTGESCALGLFRPIDRTVAFVAVKESSHPLTYRVPLNAPAPIYLGASGRAILASVGNEIADLVIDRDLAADPDAVLTASAARESIADIRQRGYAITQSEKLLGAVGIAAPVFGATGKVVGCLCITIPEARFDASRSDALAGVLVREVNKLSAALGSSRSAGALGQS